MMDRRRALMMAQGGKPQGDTVPGKLVTIPVSITQSSEIYGVVQQLVSNYSINYPAIIITAKKISNLMSDEFVAVVINSTGGASMAMRYHNNNIETYNSWSSGYAYYCEAGTQFYVLETQPSSNSIQLSGYIVAMTGNITNGQNLRTIVQDSMGQKGVSRYSIMMIAKEKTAWIDRQFVCAIIENNGLAYSSGNYGPFRYESSTNTVVSRVATSTYDFRSTSGEKYYVVEMEP